MKAEGSLGCRVAETMTSGVEFRIWRLGIKTKHRITSFDFRREDFGLFRDLLRRMPWETALEKKGVQKSWSVFKDHLCQAKKLSNPMCRRMAGGLRR